MVRGTGVVEAGGSHRFDQSKAKGDGFAVPAWPGGTYVQKVGVLLEKLRSGLETIGGEPRYEQGGSDQEGNGGIEDLEIVCHDTLSKILGRDRSPFEGPTVTSDGAKCQRGVRECKCLLFKGAP